jgi:UDP-N-acetylglucosamine transferase subunit ALG13
LIFVTVGNWYLGFDRLVEAVDRLKESGVISDLVVAQIGAGRYKPRNLSFLDFCSPEEFTTMMGNARLIISHAGIGTIAQAISQSKPVIVVPRKASLREHFDDHQLISSRQLEAEGKILVAYEVSELPTKLQQAENFIPARTHKGQQIVEAVDSFIRKLAVQKYGYR